jgi:hypothetical protein
MVLRRQIHHRQRHTEDNTPRRSRSLRVRPLQPRLVVGLSSDPIVIVLEEADFKSPERNTVHEIVRVCDVSMLTEFLVRLVSNTFEVAIVTGKHQASPQQTGQRPFL